MAVTISQMQPLTPAYQSFLGGMNGVQGVQKQAIENQYLPGMSKAKQSLLEAQAQREQALARLPFGGMSLPGVAGQIAGLETIKMFYGADSPQYRQAESAFDLEQNRMRALIAYQTSNVGLKNLPTDVKNTVIGQGMPIGPGTIGAGGMMPRGGQIPAAPAAQGGSPSPAMAAVQGGSPMPTPVTNLNTPLVQKAAQARANRDIAGTKITDRAAAGRALENLIQMPQVDQLFNTLADYSGMTGRLKAQSERVTNPEAYLKYQSATNQLNGLIVGSLKVLEGYPSTDQGIQQAKGYFQDAQKLLFSDPTAARNYIKQGTGLLRAETQSVTKAASPIFPNALDETNSTGKEPRSTNAGSIPKSQNQGTKTLDGKTYVNINGKWYEQ